MDAERPAAVSGQLLGVVWLDPRVEYGAMTLTSVDERPRRSALLQGIAFKTYISDPDLIHGDWLQEWNERNAPKPGLWQRIKEKVGYKVCLILVLLHAA